MAQDSAFWAGTAVGDAASTDIWYAPYTSTMFSDVIQKMLQLYRGTDGVVWGYLNDLIVTNPAGTTIRIATGAAVIDGSLYENTAVVDDPDGGIVAPGAGSNFYNVVLRKSWAAQTVRIALLGPNVAAPDTPTTTDGTTWEVSIGTIEIDNGSVVTVTDTREPFPPTAAPVLVRRQGDGGDDWNANGTTDADVDGAGEFQCGSIRWTGGAAALGTQAVTFPRAYADIPLVFLTVGSSGAAQDDITAVARSVTANGFTVGWVDNGGDNQTGVTFYWIALGARTVS